MDSVNLVDALDSVETSVYDGLRNVLPRISGSMADLNTPRRRTTVPVQGSSCLRTTTVGCLLLLVFGFLISMWIFNRLMKVPAYRDYKVCAEHVVEIGKAIDRYHLRTGEYPSSLEKLYPSFLEKRDVLHCPRDNNPRDTISYQYTPPTEKSPPDTIIISCKRHILMPGQSPTEVALRKDGKLATPAFQPVRFGETSAPAPKGGSSKK